MFLINLQLFAEGGDGNSAASANANATGVNAQDAAVQGDNGKHSLSAAQRGSIAIENDFEPEQHTAVAADGQAAETSPVVDKAKAFEKLIKTEYKDQFDERTQKIINQRFKETKSLEETMGKINPVLEMLGKKYGVDTKDLDKLVSSIQQDDSYYEKEAMDRGLTVEQLKTFKQMENENIELRRAEQERAKQEQSQKIYSEWLKQSEQLKGLYPNFDLRAEINNSDFMKVLRIPGMDVRTAFEVAHRSELIAPAMAQTAQQVSQALANNIKANGARPAENGTSSRASSTVKSDVSKLTKAEREDIYRRVVEQGAKNITF